MLLYFRLRCVPVVLALLMLSLPLSAADDDLAGGVAPEIQREIDYAEALIANRLPSYADIVINDLTRKHPEAAPLVKVLRLQGLIARGAWDEVKKAIAAERDPNSQETWAMKLALADGYYAWGEYANAEGIYQAFFKAFPGAPPAAIKDFYINSSYRYARMLILMGYEERAVKAYERVIEAQPPKHVARQMKSELAELLLTIAEKQAPVMRGPYFQRIEKIAEEILWQQDVWFGKAIVMLAHVKVLQDDIEGANQLVDDYKSTLKQIDDILREQGLEQLSPMAQCRYLLGVMLQERALKVLDEGGNRQAAEHMLAGKPSGPGGKRKGGAYRHFLTVFIAYPATPWAADAGMRAEQVATILRDEFGADLKTSVDPAKMEEVRSFQFKAARVLLNQGKFREAADTYVKVLNLFPEGDASLAAVGELTRAYIELNESIHAETCINYLAEVFSQRPEAMNIAGDQLMRIAEIYGERNEKTRRMEIYNLFFKHFKAHPLAPVTEFQFGERGYSQGDYGGALTYYQSVSTNYPSSPLRFKALRKVALCYQHMEKPAQEIKTLATLVEALSREKPPGPDYILARFQMANAYRKLGAKYIPTAVKQYSAIAKLLNKPDDPRFALNGQDADRNRTIAQGCMFYKGVCLTRLNPPEEKVAAYRAAAIKAFEGLVAKFPDSDYAPGALSQAGTLYTVLEKPDDAQRVFKQLQDKYPDAPESRNVLFLQGKALLDMGMRSRATKVFARMFSGEGNYPLSQILTAGDELYKAGEFEISLQAYDRVIQESDNASQLQRAMLGKGKVLVDRKDYKGALNILQKLMDEYPRNAYTVEISLYLSRAYSEVASRESNDAQRFDLFNKAITAMKTARQYDTSPGGLARSDVEIGRIQILKAEVEGEMGDPEKAKDYLGKAAVIFLQLIMFGDASDGTVRPHLEAAFGLGLPVLNELERWDDIASEADRYLELFPNGANLTEVRRLRSRARAQLAVQGAEEETTTATEDQP